MRTTRYRKGEGEDFAFTSANEAEARKIIARYPDDRQASAVIGLLYLAQGQCDGWLPPKAIEYVANYLEMAPIRVHEVVSFYSMFNDKPVGRHLVQVCRTTPCWLRGAGELTEACLDKLGVGLGEPSDDGLFTVVEVECLGACANAPMVQINDHYYEDLTSERLIEMIDELRAGKDVTAGSQSGRQTSAPEGGPKTLQEVPVPQIVPPDGAGPLPDAPRASSSEGGGGS
jgi:NADH-quinone oxidoreductase subunit E